MTQYKFNGQKMKTLGDIKERVKTFIPAEADDIYMSEHSKPAPFLTKLEFNKVEYKSVVENGIIHVLFEARRKQRDGTDGLKLRWCKRFQEKS